MRKILACLLVVSLLMGAVCVSVAEEQEPEVFESGNWKYIVLEDGTVEIINYESQQEIIHIPETLDGKIVTSIGDWAFDGCRALKTIVIPDSVRNIGANPFIRCFEFSRINISSDHPWLEIIDGALISKPDKRLVCYPASLKSNSYEIPQGVLIIGDRAFWGSQYLNSVTIPDSVTSIGINPFGICHYLHDFNVSPDHPYLATIDDVLFSKPDKRLVCYSSALYRKSYEIPQGIEIIGDEAFDNSHLESVTIPDSVTSIGVNPFVASYSLSEINVSPDHPYLALVDGVLFSKPDKRLVCYPAALSSEHYEIAQGTEIIGEYAFYDCNSLTSIIIPDGVTCIDDSAFYSCYNLTSVSIPDSVITIGNRAFAVCENLSSITIPDGVTSIGKETFRNCKSLKSVTISDGVTNIGDKAFRGCKSLSSFSIPDSVTSIGEEAFYHCSALTSVSIPYGVTKIRKNSFRACGSLTTITIPNSVTSIGEDAFYDCESLSSIIIPDSVTMIGEGAFGECDGLISVIIQDGVTTIGGNAFSHCRSLSSITIPNSVTSIEGYAFYDCIALKSITIPESVTSIGKEVFGRHGQLTVIVPRGSYAAQYCQENGLDFSYPDSNDWLND